MSPLQRPAAAALRSSEPLPLILTSWRQASFQAVQPAYGFVIGTLHEKPSHGENNHPEIVASLWKGQPREHLRVVRSSSLSFSPSIYLASSSLLFLNPRLHAEFLAAALHPFLIPFLPFASFSLLSLGFVAATTSRNYLESRKRKRKGERDSIASFKRDA